MDDNTRSPWASQVPTLVNRGLEHNVYSEESRRDSSEDCITQKRSSTDCPIKDHPSKKGTQSKDSSTTEEWISSTEWGCVDIDGIDWRPGFKARFPKIGFAGLIVVILATGAAVSVLVKSDKQRVDDWPFKSCPAQPNVLLNVANQIQNLGLFTLISQGVAIAWWRRALHGTTLSNLHRNHAYSYSFLSILTYFKHFNLIALAGLMAKFAVIDSTLFQTATKTAMTLEKGYTQANMKGWIETRWIAGAGGIPREEGTIQTIDTAWAGILDAYNEKVADGRVQDSPMDKASFFGCPFQHECSGHIKGLGFAYNCSTKTEHIDYGQQQPHQGGIATSYPLWDARFDTAWANRTRQHASINLEMLYVDSRAGPDKNSCPGTLTRRSCEIRPALVQYPITITIPSEEELKSKNILTHIKFFNDNSTWPVGTTLDDVEQIDDVEILEYTNLVEHFNQTSTVGGLAYIMNHLYGSSVNLTLHNDAWGIISHGASVQTMFPTHMHTPYSDRCWYNINKADRDDPAVEILRKLNMLSFVAGLYIKGAPSINATHRALAGMSSQNFTASVSGLIEEYQTSFRYMYGALGATFVTVLLVLPAYWGFWQLGRKVTLGPLEISQAFGAPILAPDRMKAYHGNFKQVLKDVGKRKVQYGQLKGAPPGQMGLREPEKVADPKARQRWEISGQKEKRLIGLSAVFAGLVGASAGHSHS